MNLGQVGLIMCTCLASGTSTLADAARNVGQSETARQNSVFFYDIEWRVYCELGACAATEGHIWLVCFGGDLFLTAKEGVEIQHWYNRSAQPLPLAEPLDSFQVSTLLAEGKLVLLADLGDAVVQVARISTPPIERVLEAMLPHAACVPPGGPNSYRLLLDDQQRANQNQNVPVNKPQVEFAIRSQTGAFE
ncbi:hypothetical protein SAMN05444003_1060 [Cognatiyoonia sediminum]|uniref:Uncharacterized protein n=2 Tax=Cognatiyoonia sediminum TaxID=1508389 RepID=A0A1M5MWK9_9RHOB|nr:hypothetical protein SAMN05444003_1060 [Cognatiyoonia sediminum]